MVPLHRKHFIVILWSSFRYFPPRCKAFCQLSCGNDANLYWEEIYAKYQISQISCQTSNYFAIPQEILRNSFEILLYNWPLVAVKIRNHFSSNGKSISPRSVEIFQLFSFHDHDHVASFSFFTWPADPFSAFLACVLDWFSFQFFWSLLIEKWTDKRAFYGTFCPTIAALGLVIILKSYLLLLRGAKVFGNPPRQGNISLLFVFSLLTPNN